MPLSLFHEDSLHATVQDFSVDNLLEQLPCVVFIFQFNSNCFTDFSFISNNLQEVTGVSLSEVTENAAIFLNKIHPDDIGLFFDSAKTASENTALWRIEFRLKHPAKDEIWVEWQARPTQKNTTTFWQGYMLDISSRKQAEQSRQKHEQNFHSLANTAPCSIICYDLEGRIRYLNNELAQLLNANVDDVIGRHPSEIWPDGRYDQIVQTAKQVVKHGRPTIIEFWNNIDPPRPQYHQIHIVPNKDSSGQIVGTYAFGFDGTELKTAHDFNEKLLNSLPDPVFVKDRHHRWRLVNDAFCTLLGKSRDELLGKSDYDFLPAEQADIFWEKDELVFNNQREHINDEIITNADGEQLFIQTKKTLVADDTLLGIIRDLTRFKQVEAEVRASEEKLRGLFDISSMGIVLTDLEGHYLEFNEAFQNICGYSREELKQLDHWSLTPEEYKEKQAQHLRLLDTQGYYDHYEKEYIRKDGSRISLRLNGVKIHDHTGTPYIWSIVEDISEQKNAETRLRMAAGVFDAASEGIVITDPNSLILDINPAFTTITGYTKEEALGQHINLLTSGSHNKSFYQDMWSTLLTEGSWSGEVINRHKNGHLYTERLNIVTVHDEVGQVKQYIAIFSDITELKRHEQHLQHIAHHDSLTGLANRRLLTERLTRAMTKTNHSGNKLAIFYFDLDGFKPVNDNYGHEIGDKVLVEVAHRLNSSLRPNDTVARIGGDEFVVLLTDISDIAECEYTAKRLLEMFSQPITVNDFSLKLTVSIGICLYPDNQEDDADILLRYADLAMYIAKSSGRNQFVFYNPETQQKTSNNNEMLHDLRQALKQNQISVHYQPIIDITTGRVVKAEALLRWQHPTQGMISPSTFIPVAENGGLIHELGDFVFQESARVAKLWNEMSSQPLDNAFRISINRSPRQFFHHNGVNKWINYLNEQNIPGELLVIEITEGLLLDDRVEVIQQLSQLHAAGMEISLDDFGTGYSALSYLKKFNIDHLKIDRSFIRDITSDPDDRAIVESIIVMAKRLGIKLIAEGVETQEQSALLKTTECEMAQGYLYSKPIPEADFLEFVSSH